MGLLGKRNGSDHWFRKEEGGVGGEGGWGGGEGEGLEGGVDTSYKHNS